MLVQSIEQARQSAHVVVLGNEKGGSGKSTTALHIAVALLKAGQRVATVDLVSRQKSFTHYIENRRAWGERARVKLDLPTHYWVERAERNSLEANEAAEPRRGLRNGRARRACAALPNPLPLPLSENGKRRPAARAEWYSVMD